MLVRREKLINREQIKRAPKKIWIGVILKYMDSKCLNELDSNEWRRIISVIDPTYSKYLG